MGDGRGERDGMGRERRGEEKKKKDDSRDEREIFVENLCFFCISNSGF